MNHMRWNTRCPLLGRSHAYLQWLSANSPTVRLDKKTSTRSQYFRILPQFTATAICMVCIGKLFQEFGSSNVITARSVDQTAFCTKFLVLVLLVQYTVVRISEILRWSFAAHFCKIQVETTKVCCRYLAEVHGPKNVVICVMWHL